LQYILRLQSVIWSSDKRKKLRSIRRKTRCRVEQ